MRALIADDEKLARNELAFHLREFRDIEIVAEAEDGDQTLELIRKTSPDLVFLDIQMPGKDGLRVAKKLLDDKKLPCIIFVSAYDQYALRAFEVHATDYLLKPIEFDRLQKCIERVRKTEGLEQMNRESLTELLEDLTKEKKGVPQEYAYQIAVKRGARIFPVPVEDIRFARTRDSIVEIATSEGVRMTHFVTLEELEEILDPKLFFRVHRSYLVNLNRIQEIVPLSNQTYFLKLRDCPDIEIPLSRNHAKELRKMMRF